MSIVPTLTGLPQQPHEFLYWEFYERGFEQVVRIGDWKAVRHGPDQPLELYDLKSDIAETTDVAVKHPEVVRKIEQYLVKARTEPAQPIPTKGGRKKSRSQCSRRAAGRCHG
jgi:hypothetical protein